MSDWTFHHEQLEIIELNFFLFESEKLSEKADIV